MIQTAVALAEFLQLKINITAYEGVEKMKEFIEQLKKIKKGVDFETETDLFDDGLLDSFDVLSIIGMLDKVYDVTVPPSQIIPENFNSAQAMWNMKLRLEEE